MKRSRAIIIVCVFYFLSVNTADLWEYIGGGIAFVLSILIFLGFIVLAFVLLTQVGFAVVEKFRRKHRNVSVLILAIVLITTYFFRGIIDWDRLMYGKDVMVVRREGVAGCGISLKLKSSGTFVNREVCFGIDKDIGTYEIVNDTVYFKYDTLEISYMGSIAVIEMDSIKAYDNSIGILKIYKNKADTMPLPGFSIYEYNIQKK